MQSAKHENFHILPTFDIAFNLEKERGEKNLKTFTGTEYRLYTECSLP